MNKEARFTFGIYKGLTLDQVASTPKGLLYLDSMVDWMKEKGMNISDPTFYGDLVEYVSDENVSKEIEEAIEDKESFKSVILDPEPPKWWEKR